ncbi:YidC/Oxa1 family membrane protein insertase [Thermophilibacter provencensis]|jgi:YidC/Oxa1 family membrane protein insertase|uniref:Membrane protein insertase YidC n=1 Tax=Thermophilibacter provencensis TaxID=1852386 RepID=A0A921GH17_9ACTN|nr:YidC/Oxa1 family membrane protein insertase [Thermophilibacter provencensis]MBM6814862.1 YidC/Oxa1 family membrane protein insertase [Olsenella uli]HJF45948.1 YidC/Oxa1 family membrane protein insertase [Thermophilibacter provencensis]
MWDWFINFLTAVLAGIEGFVGDWGLAVIILTVIIRLILTPLMAHSTKSTARMQVMQPKLQEIQERYADNPERQAEEMRKIYADMKFNPLGGCLPIFLQMPVFFGLFTVARQVPADASFFGILPSISLSVSQVIEASGWVAAAPYILFDVLFGVLTFVPMVINVSTQAEAQRSQTMTMGAVMAVMMLFFGWSVPAAVLLYYVTSSLWQVIQQKVITQRVMEKAKAEAEAEAAGRPIEVDVVRKEKKARPHKKG